MKRWIIILLLINWIHCEKLQHIIQNWSRKHREKRIEKISQEDLAKWKYELRVSEKEAETLYEQIQKYAQEKKIQGELAWKIGKALMKQGSYEISQQYYQLAIDKQLPEEEIKTKQNIYESALPYFQRALQLYKPIPDLLLDAGICYANSSRVLGWEEERFKTAIFLLERGAKAKPEDIRFHYTLALLYGKTTNSYRNVSRALELLDYVIKRDPYHIPAFFAKAHILVENGNLQEGFNVYEKITEVLEEMYKNNLLKGDITRNPKYQKAIRNMKELQFCIEGKPECKIQIRNGT